MTPDYEVNGTDEEAAIGSERPRVEVIAVCLGACCALVLAAVSLGSGGSMSGRETELRVGRPAAARPAAEQIAAPSPLTSARVDGGASVPGAPAVAPRTGGDAVGAVRPREGVSARPAQSRPAVDVKPSVDRSGLAKAIRATRREARADCVAGQTAARPAPSAGQIRFRKGVTTVVVVGIRATQARLDPLTLRARKDDTGRWSIRAFDQAKGGREVTSQLFGHGWTARFARDQKRFLRLEVSPTGAGVSDRLRVKLGSALGSIKPVTIEGLVVGPRTEDLPNGIRVASASQ